MNLKRIFVMAGLCLSVLAADFIWRAARGAKPVTYQTVAPERRRLAAKVTATGTLSALVTVQVGSQVSGQIQLLNADFNSPVKKGQVIAKLDPQFYQAALVQSQANASAARGNLTKAQIQAQDAVRQQTRAHSLFDQKLIGQADLDTADANAHAAQAQVAVARGAVDQAGASLHQAQINLNYTSIVSPVDGVVISRNVDVGQTVAASLSAPTLFVIAGDLRKMQVDSNIAEADVGKLKPDMRAFFTVDAWPGERFPGIIRQVRNASVTVQNVVTYDAVIDVDNTELKLKPGMTANVTVIYAQKNDALSVPNAALRFHPADEALPTRSAVAPRSSPRSDAGSAASAESAGSAADTGGRNSGGGRNGGGRGEGGRGGGFSGRGGGAPVAKAVWVLRAGKPVKVEVQTGINDGSFTEIVGDGLTESDAVITDSDGPVAKPASTPAGPLTGGGQTRRLF